MTDNEIKQYKVIPTKRAKYDLSAHANFLKRVSLNAGLRLFDEFEYQIASLSIFPHRYPYLDIDGVPPKTYRKLVFGNYMALYKIDEDFAAVYISAVIDCRSDYAWLLNIE